jgi:hypothetical protein
VTGASSATCEQDDGGWMRLEGQSAAGSPTSAHVATSGRVGPVAPTREGPRREGLRGICGGESTRYPRLAKSNLPRSVLVKRAWSPLVVNLA